MAQSTLWILVCDASRARLFQMAQPEQLKLLEELDHPSSRVKSRDLMADTNGRKPNGQAAGQTDQRPGAAPDTEPKEVEAMKFAQELAKMLDKGRVENQFDRLVLAAPPHFLGLLKGTLDDQVQKLLAHSVDKDLTKIQARELPERLSLAQVAANLA
jgi:protein required for attachment to host cells